jgi:AcrR family transcriptional regulator
MSSPAAAARAAKKKKEQPDGAKAQLTPSDWINAATALLVDKSIDAVGVDVLAKNLGVTRGSFYWHFTNREDLLNHILTTWRDNATEQIISRFTQKGIQPRELIHELTMLPFKGRAANQASSVELAIRAWARRDPAARQVVDQVDAQRLSYIAQCFSAMGMSIAEARTRAFLLYGYELSESLLSNQGTESEKVSRRAFIEGLLLSEKCLKCQRGGGL